MKLLSLILCLMTFDALACICNYPKSDERIDEMFRNADVVFIGTVEPTSSDTVDVQNGEYGKVTTFRIDTIYKGKRKREIKKIIQRNTDCSARFKPGQKYIIFGYFNGKQTETNSCGAFIFHPDIELIKKMLNRFSPRLN